MDSGPEPAEPPLRFSSHGKLLLFGEHAAVYGYPALGISLDSKMELLVHPLGAPGDSAGNTFPGLNDRDHNSALSLLASAVELIPNLEFPPSGYDLNGDVPRSTGFGSSAAVCVNIASYILLLAERQAIDLEGLLPKFQHSSSWPEEEKRHYLHWQIANHLEKHFHGSPSGIDTGLAMGSGIQAFFPRSRRLPDVLKLYGGDRGIWIVYGAVPREGNTKALVARIQHAMLREEGKVPDAMEALGEYAHAAIDCLQNEEQDDRAQKLGTLATQAQEILDSLGLNSEGTEKLLDKARKMGSTGGKISGAGGGGAFYFYCESESSAREIQEQLTVFAAGREIELTHPLKVLKIQ